MSRHVTSCHVMSCHVTSWDAEKASRQTNYLCRRPKIHCSWAGVLFQCHILARVKRVLWLGLPLALSCLWVYPYKKKSENLYFSKYRQRRSWHFKVLPISYHFLIDRNNDVILFLQGDAASYFRQYALLQQNYRSNWVQSHQSLLLYSKTHVTVCLHCSWWRNPWCHSHFKPVTAQRLAPWLNCVLVRS